MTVYSYEARDLSGREVTGELKGEGPVDVRDKLVGMNLFPIKIRTKPFHKIEERLKGLFNSIKLEDKISLTREFYTLFKAGMNIDEILVSLIRQSQKAGIREILEGVRKEVGSGSSLSAAVSGYPQLFDRLYVNLVMAGEAGGILETVLKNLVKLLRKEATLKSRIKSALLYPKIVVATLVGATFVMITFVLPKFEALYGRFGAELPLPTKILIKTSTLVSDFWWIIPVGGISLWWLFRRYIRSPRGRVRWGRFLFRVPIFGKLNQKIANARFCHLLSALYGSGLPMTRCVELCSEVVDNGYFAQEIRFIHGAIYQGKTLSEAMRSCHSFSTLTVDATNAGEISGSLDEILSQMGEHYEDEIDATLDDLTTMLEPILLFVIFGMVSLFALAIFLPMWNLSRVVTG